jgi:2-polyprenyl-3-methyl-5-hydroxy-6-metoxy-1,4-benzoquinol methylase
MPSRDYYEDLWQLVPEGLEPPYFKRRLSFLLERLGQDAGRVLDVGCGEGRFTRELASAGARVVGVDVAEEPLRRARAQCPGLELWLIAEGERWPFEDASFDAVWAGEVIEHVVDTARWLSEIRRVLRPQGSLLLSTPAHAPLTRMRLALSARAFAAHFDPCGEHLRFYDRRTLTGLLEEFGFHEISIAGIGGLPLAPAVMLAGARRRRF